MSTGQKNTVVRSVNPNSIFEDASNVIDSSLTCAQGDFLVFDTGTNKIKVPALETDGATMLGISRQKLVSGQPASPYQGTAVDAAQAAPALPGPQFGIEVRAVAKTGDAFVPGCNVYLDPATGGRGVSSTGTKAVGVYQGPSIGSASAGQEIVVHIGARFPTDSLKL